MASSSAVIELESAVESAEPAQASVAAEPRTAVPKHTYTQILKSTAVIGGSSVLNILFGIVRNKVMALCLGPGGVGLMGLFTSIADLTFNLAGLGVQSSGVRQIAEAVGSGEAVRVARTATVLRRVSVALGLLGAGILVALATPISRVTFASDQYAAGVALLSVAVFCRLVSAGQGALVQGMRRISDLAQMSVLGAGVGTAASIPLIYFFRERAIVPSLIVVAGVSVIISWWYSRKIRVDRPTLRVREVLVESGALLKLGAAFMASGFLTMGAGYAIRIIVLRKAGIEAAGLYQAAWALGGIYVGFILTAMGADFYPRLTAVATDHNECNRLVNEQAQVSLLLAGPGALATLTLAPLVIQMFYSSKFAPAVPILRWVCLGMTLRVIAWPMGFIILAKGAQLTFFLTEVAASTLHVGLAWILVSMFGLPGSGAAFFGLYVWHTLLINAIVRRQTGFRWSAANVKLGAIFLPLTVLVFVSSAVLPFWLSSAIGVVAVVVASVHSLRTLIRLFPLEWFPHAVRPWLPRLGFSLGDAASGR